MAYIYPEKIRRIQNRYNPGKERLVEQRMFSSLEGADSDVSRYVKLAMNEVDSVYTDKVISAGNDVKSRLAYELRNVSYRFQGSVMTQTHIRAASDIDLLTICDKYSNTEIGRVRTELQYPAKYTNSQLNSLKRYSENFSMYQGYELQDLRDLRSADEHIIARYYYDYDLTKPKSIKVRPSQYGIDVDVVVAAWFDSFDYVLRDKDEAYRGIGIYNKKEDIRENPSLPFLSIKRINDRSSETNGRLKRMIRFLKNVKEDANQEIDLTSFEINAICYDIPKKSYENAYYLDLVRILWNRLRTISKNLNTAQQILSVDGTEKVFVKNPQRFAQVAKLEDAVWQIYKELFNT
jgi:hypothetical protein